MRPQSRRLAILAPLLLVVGCTVPTFQHPLVSPGESLLPTELSGSYRFLNPEENSDAAYLHVGAAGEEFPRGFVRLIGVNRPADPTAAIKSDTFLGFTRRVGDELILHLPVPKSGNLEQQSTVWAERFDSGEVSAYLLVRIHVTAKGLELTLLNNEFLIQEIRAGRLTGTHIPKDPTKMLSADTIAITASTEELNAFFAKHVRGDLFTAKAMCFVRID